MSAATILRIKRGIPPLLAALNELSEKAEQLDLLSDVAADNTADYLEEVYDEISDVLAELDVFESMDEE